MVRVCAGAGGYKDEDGYFWFVGRADDVIKSSGYRIGPFEIESALKEHPAVHESGAVASPDLKRGQIVKAYVVLTDEYQQKLLESGPEFQSTLNTKGMLTFIDNKCINKRGMFIDHICTITTNNNIGSGTRHM